MTTILQKDYFEFSLGVIFTTAGFVSYYYLNRLVSVGRLIGPGRDENDNHRKILFQRLLGAFIFGVLPSILFLTFTARPMNEVGLTDYIPQRTFLYLLISVLIILPMNFMNSRHASNLAVYPQIRMNEWSLPLLVVSALSWIVYLFAYELLFRGILLFSSVDLLGFWPSAFLNAGIYSLVHIPKGPTEALGALPLGLILSYLVISTGSFWVAFFIHIVLALSNEWFSLYHHPVIRLKTRA